MGILPYFNHEHGVPTIHLGLVGLIIIFLFLCWALSLPIKVYLQYRRENWWRKMTLQPNTRKYVKAKFKTRR